MHILHRPGTLYHSGASHIATSILHERLSVYGHDQSRPIEVNTWLDNFDWLPSALATTSA